MCVYNIIYLILNFNILLRLLVIFTLCNGNTQIIAATAFDLCKCNLLFSFVYNNL